jgi:hypothetical protein
LELDRLVEIFDRAVVLTFFLQSHAAVVEWFAKAEFSLIAAS